MFAIRLTIVAMNIVLYSAAAEVSARDEWPQFRGPGGQGHAGSADLPLEWSETKNVKWKTPIPGEGHSSPVISDDQIWITSAIARALSPEEEQKRLSTKKNPKELQLAGSLRLVAIQIDRNTGKIARQIELFEVSEPEPKHALNSYASPTPVISGNEVYFHFGTYGTACVDRTSGKVMWKNVEFHVDHQNGPGSSPIVWQEKLIIHFDGTDHQFIAAFDRLTGKVAWQTKRSGTMDSTPELRKSYGTPLIVQTESGPQVISPAANWVYAYDPRDGREIWKVGYGKLGFSTVPRPVVSGDTMFIATSYMQSRLLAVRYGSTATGDLTGSHVKWMSDRQIPKKPSMLVLDDRLYLASDMGIARCIDTGTGEDIWVERMPGEYSASPVTAAGRLYFFNQEGLTTVVADSKQYKELAQNKLDGRQMASPAVAGSALYIRTDSHMYRIENR